MTGGIPALLADIGGTHARFRIFANDTLIPLPAVRVADHATVESAISTSLAHHQGPTPVVAMLAVAGPVVGGRMHLTNAPWDIDANSVRARCGFSDVRLLNDFAAVAWSVPVLTDNDLVALGGGPGDAAAPRVVLGPGTGLGAAAYLPVGGGHVVAGEGGHASLAAADAREDAIVAHLRSRFGHVSAERAISGPGLINLYRAIAAVDGIPVDARSAEDISRDAIAGTCGICRSALEMFCAMLGDFAGNLALTFGARGGIYLAGGIAPQIQHILRQSRFRDRLIAKGRFQSWLETIPVHLVIHPEPAFVGLARFAGHVQGLRRPHG